MRLPVVRQALAEQIRDVASLQVLETPGAVTGSPVVLFGPMRGSYRQEMGADTMDVEWPLMVAVSRNGPDQLTVLQDLLSPGGERSIVDAIDYAPPAAGVANSWAPLRFEEPEELELNGTPYWGVALTVSIRG